MALIKKGYFSNLIDRLNAALDSRAELVISQAL